jgi:hypothetical protein
MMCSLRISLAAENIQTASGDAILRYHSFIYSGAKPNQRAAQN